MCDKPINILHVFEDEKFFDSVAECFELLEGVNNRFVYFNEDESYKFRFIKNTSRLKITSDRNEYLSVLSDPCNDIVYFHSLPAAHYDYMLSVSDHAKVIWWAWGFDIYDCWHGCRAFVDLDLYKPKTASYIGSKRTVRYLVRQMIFRVLAPIEERKRMRVLSRVDYFSPVIPVEYDLMTKLKHFKAKPFMLECGPVGNEYCEFSYHTKASNILIGNSLTLTNNHLDVFDYISECRCQDNQTFLVPVSYGSELDLSILKALFKSRNVRWLDSYMPYEEYMSLLNGVSHAVFGVMRQQAMGNILKCLRNGTMIFLFKDSIVYKYLKDAGYYVFAIEDMTSDSFTVPLDEKSAYHNYCLATSRVVDMKAYMQEELYKVVKKK